MNVFIDESGELGSGARSTRYFVIASIATENTRRLERLVKGIWLSKYNYHYLGELHANRVDDSTRMRLLGQLAAESVEVRFSVIRKRPTQISPQEQYYQAMAGHILSLPRAKVIVIDRKDTNASRIKIISRLGLEAAFRDVKFVDSRSMKQLQAADFVAWAVLTRYEHGDSKYLDLLDMVIAREIVI